MNNIFEKFKVLIIDDEEDITDILDTVLKREGFSNIYIANNGTDGIELFKKVNPDIVLLDIMLPDISGYDVFNELRKDSQIPILFISAKTEEVDRLLGFAIGADDYIIKPFQIIELRARIHAVIRRFYGRTNPTIEVGALTINPASRKVYIYDKEVKLAAKEFDIIEYIASRHPFIVSKMDIAEHVYDEFFDPLSSVLRVHIARLKRKLKEVAGKEIIITNRGIGYSICEK